jgi:hypothetical protein
VGGGGCKARCKRKTEPLGPMSWTFETLSAARIGKKKNTSKGSGGITFSNPVVVGVADRVKIVSTQGSDGSFSGLGRMISSPQHLRLQSIEVRSEACLVHLVGVKCLVKSLLECTGRRGIRGLMLMI